LVYNAYGASFLRALNLPRRTVSHDPSRKHFLAKLIGLFAVVGIAPRLLAKPVQAPSIPAAPAASGITLRPESRAVARRGDAA